MVAVIKITEDENADHDIPPMFEVHLFSSPAEARRWHEAQPMVDHISYYHTEPHRHSK